MKALQILIGHEKELKALFSYFNEGNLSDTGKQSVKLIEELGELISAIAKRQSGYGHALVCEEMADALILISQFLSSFSHYQDGVAEQVAYKLNKYNYLCTDEAQDKKGKKIGKEKKSRKGEKG